VGSPIRAKQFTPTLKAAASLLAPPTFQFRYRDQSVRPPVIALGILLGAVLTYFAFSSPERSRVHSVRGLSSDGAKSYAMTGRTCCRGLRVE
jgi:hypothetical protein